MQPLRTGEPDRNASSDIEAPAARSGLPADLLEAFAARCREGFVVTDGRGTILFANPAAEALLARHRQTCIGEAFPAALSEAQNTEIELASQDPASRVIEVDCAELTWEGRRVCFLSLRDAAQRRRVEGETRLAIRRRDEFLATLSHELRNPLAAISNAAIVLRKQGAQEDTLSHAREIIERQCRQMTRLLEDLLDMSRIAQGKMQLQKECHNLQTIVKEAVDAIDALMREHDLKLEVSLPPEPVYVDADPVRLHQVLINLLSNAAKYSDRGRSVHLNLHRDSTEAVISVRDEGIGMSERVLASVFEPYVQAGGSVARSEGGLGIGLSLVKSIVDLHGGTIAAASAGPGCGSEFVVRLPLSYSVPAPTRSGGPTRTMQRLRVLVVEDNSDVRHMLTTLLELEGHDVEAAVDGLQGLEMIELYQPDVALVDIGLPGLDGYELARQVRGNPENENVYLVALTGYGERKDRRRALQSGFDAHLAKPVDLEDLTRILFDCSKNKSGSSWEFDVWEPGR